MRGAAKAVANDGIGFIAELSESKDGAAEEGALSLRSGSPRSRLSSPSHAALTAPPFAAMTTTRTRVRPSESTLLVAGGICIPLMSQSLSLARSSRHQDHASLCLSAEGPPDLCDRPCVARGRRRRAEIRQEFGSLRGSRPRRRPSLALLAPLVSGIREGEGCPFKTPARGLGTCPVLALRPRTLIMRKTRLRVMRLNPVLRREVGREQDEVRTTALTG